MTKEELKFELEVALGSNRQKPPEFIPGMNAERINLTK